MSIDAFEKREKMLDHRAEILEAELSRISGEQTYTVEQIRGQLKQKYANAKMQGRNSDS